MAAKNSALVCGLILDCKRVCARTRVLAPVHARVASDADRKQVEVHAKFWLQGRNGEEGGRRGYVGEGSVAMDNGIELTIRIPSIRARTFETREKTSIAIDEVIGASWRRSGAPNIRPAPKNAGIGISVGLISDWIKERCRCMISWCSQQI